MVDVSNVHVWRRNDGGVLHAGASATVDGRTVSGEGGSPTDALAALMWAIIDGADEARVVDGRPTVTARTDGTPALTVQQ